MKFILKGKQFLARKLQQMDIAADNANIITQQIPFKLRQPLKVLMRNQIDLQSNEKYETYFKNYPNHHLSHYLLQKYEMSLQANSLPSHYQLPPEQQEVYIPPFDKQLEYKALLLREVVDEYDEGFTKIDQPIICMAVVHFHHKRGAQAEYKYPTSKVVDSIENLLVHHAMPDSSHNKMEDYNYFNFEGVVKGKRRMLFGVSYFKQIKVTEEMKANNKQITRSYIQKALAVVSYLPIFGYLKLRLSSTTKAFFNDFTNYNLINLAYHDLSANLTDSWPRMDMNELYIGSDLRVIINLFGVQEFYQIWRAVLYQKRVVVFAHSSSSASSFIISLLTLFPGLSTFGVYSKSISKYMQSLREYALPLRTFSSDNFMAMSFHIQDFHQLGRFQKNAKGSFLIGTTNRLLKETNDYGIEILINLENCTIDKKKPRVAWEPISKRQKQFISEMEATISTEKTLAYEGSEDCIRNSFHNFLKGQLLGIMKANKALKQFMNDCNQHERRRQNAKKQERKESGEYQVIQDQRESESHKNNKVEDSPPPLIPSEVTAIPFPGLLMTNSFPYFLQFHNENLPKLIDNKTFPCLIIQNYEYYLKLDEQYFASYNWKDRKLVMGKGRPKQYDGKQIRFCSEEEANVVRHIYLGAVENNKYMKNGFYLDKNEFYEGDFSHGSKEGYGKLTNLLHKYIGDFKNDLYDGKGQLIQGKDIYVGDFKEGLKYGCGKSQGEFNYDGEWANNKPEGSGVWKHDQKQFIAVFTKGVIDEDIQVTIRYSNGSMYKGMVKNLKPEGKGFLVDENGIGRKVLFRDGQVEAEIQDVEEEPEAAQEQQMHDAESWREQS